MKGLFLLIAFFLITKGYAQQAWQWAYGAGGSGQEQTGALMDGKAVAADAFGNIYVTGSFYSPAISFGSFTLTNNGNNNDVFLVKYNSNGAVVWAVAAGYSGSDHSNAIEVDTNGDVYITGYFSDSIAFGSTTLYATGTGNLHNMFVAKYAGAGTPVWAASGGGTTAGTTITTDVAGQVYVAGNFISATATFGSTVLTNQSSGSWDMFVTKFNPAGVCLWAVSAGGASTEIPKDMDADYNGNIYIAGSFTSPSFLWGSTTVANPLTFFNDIFLISINSAGTPGWGFAFGGSNADNAANLHVDMNGDIYIAGAFNSSTLAFGSITLTNSAFGFVDGYVAKFTPAGLPLWATSFGGSSTDHACALTSDGLGNIYVGGGFTSPVFTAGAVSFSNSGMANGFIIKYSSGGTLLDTLTFGATAITGAVTGFDISLDAAGSLYLGGSFAVDLNFDTIAISASAMADVFIAKYGLPCLTAPNMPGSIAGPSATCTGISYVYSVPPVTGAVSYSWQLPAGWTGASSGNTITVTTGPTGAGSISVAATNGCGTSFQQFKAVTIYPNPTPAITQSGTTLSTGAGQGSYQWFRNSSTITGATNNSYTVTQTGSYFVRVTTGNNCTGQSNTITITSVGITNLENGALSVYPSPCNGYCTIGLPEAINAPEIIVRNIHGARAAIKLSRTGPQTIGVELLNAAPGVYLLTMKQGGSVYTGRIVVAADH